MRQPYAKLIKVSYNSQKTTVALGLSRCRNFLDRNKARRSQPVPQALEATLVLAFVCQIPLGYILGSLGGVDVQKDGNIIDDMLQAAR